MKNLRKLSIVMCLLVLILITLSGCTKTKSYTYDVETGDKIKVTLKSDKDYDMTSELPIKFSKDGDVIAQGIFTTLDTYEAYLDIISYDSDAKIIEEKEKDNIKYTFYNYNDEEYNYVIKIKDSNTCFILGSTKSQASAEDMFKKISFEVEK